MKMSRIESGLRTALAFYEAFNRRDLAEMAALFADQCRIETSDPAPDGRVLAGKDAVLAFWQAKFQESPDIHIDIEDLFGLGLRVVAQWRCEWNDAGGTAHHLRGVHIFRIQSNAVTEIISYTKR